MLQEQENEIKIIFLFKLSFYAVAVPERQCAPPPRPPIVGRLLFAFLRSVVVQMRLGFFTVVGFILRMRNFLLLLFFSLLVNLCICFTIITVWCDLLLIKGTEPWSDKCFICRVTLKNKRVGRIKEKGERARRLLSTTAELYSNTTMQWRNE